MKITVKIEDIAVEIDRPKFADYAHGISSSGSKWRKNLMEDTVLPTLEEAINKAKELYKLKQESSI